MSKTTAVKVRIKPRLKRQVQIRKGLSFDVVIPNKTTRNTFEDTDAGRDIVVCKDADDMFKKLGI